MLRFAVVQSDFTLYRTRKVYTGTINEDIIAKYIKGAHAVSISMSSSIGPISMSSLIGLGVCSVVVTPGADSSNSFQPWTIVGMAGDKSRFIANSQTRGACIEEGVFVVSRSQFGGEVCVVKGIYIVADGFGSAYC